MQLANQAAQRFDHDDIDTEHILVALIMERKGVAAQVLKGLSVSLRLVGREIERIAPPDPEKFWMGPLPLTSQAKQLLDRALKEAGDLPHSYVGTEHLLMALTATKKGVAAEVLTNLGIELAGVRKEVLKVLQHGLRPYSASR
jgi:ATP-dependent Clp protease ATP-binding subunit ClpC